MGVKGLEEIADPSRVLLSQRRTEAVGSVVVPVLEGSRPLLVEVQALTSPSALAVPRRIANGVDYNRLLMLAAVLSRRAGLSLSNQDIIVNVAGGLTIREPATDLAVAMAIASSQRNTAVDRQMAALGEVGLSGELRPVSQLQRRLTEAARLGFRQCLVPASAEEEAGGANGVEAVYAQTLSEALRRCLPRRDVGPDGRHGGRVRGIVRLRSLPFRDRITEGAAPLWTMRAIGIALPLLLALVIACKGQERTPTLRVEAPVPRRLGPPPCDSCSVPRPTRGCGCYTNPNAGEISWSHSYHPAGEHPSSPRYPHGHTYRQATRHAHAHHNFARHHPGPSRHTDAGRHSHTNCHAANS